MTALRGVRPKRGRTLITLILLGSILQASPLWGHRVGSRVIQGGLGLEAFYGDGSPMAYCQVEVFRQGDKLPFQTGATDKNGRFLFFPDPPGSYRIVINDGQGHRLERTIATERKSWHQPGEETPKNQLKPALLDILRAGSGLVLILIFYFVLKRYLK